MAAFALLALAVGLLANPIISAADPSYDGQESQFLTLINNYRESKGAADLVPQNNLNAAADWYATDMATKNYYGGPTPSGNYCAQFNETAHCDSLGRLPGERLGDFGYSSNYAGENIAAGFTTAQSVFDAWKGSTGHNRNMLDPNFKAIGIGLDCVSGTQYGCYWVTDFGANASPGSTPGASTAPTPTPAPTASPHPTTSGQPPPTNSPTPEPTPAPHLWGDFDCDGAITGADAMAVLRGGAGLSERGTGCPTISDLEVIDGQLRIWGDTDCSLTVSTLDGIELLQYLGGLPLNPADANCPPPGTLF